MLYRIHFSYKLNGREFENYYDLEGKTIEEIQDKNSKEMAKRGIDADENDCWLEKIG